MKLKLGIIGAGNIATAHIQNILDGNCPNIEIAAVADRKENRRQWAAEKLTGARIFAEGSDLIAAQCCDAVLIAVPHYQHPRLAIEAFRAGQHVMCEKPAGVYTLQVREMIAEADKHPEGRVPGLTLAAVCDTDPARLAYAAGAWPGVAC